MTRRALSHPVGLALMMAAVATTPGRAADDPRFALSFAQGLRERGYYDLAIDYLADLRKDAETPPEIRARLDFEQGRALIDAATHGSDPDRAKEQLDQARTHLDAYIKANPGKPETVEALIELAHLLYERGRTTAIAADDAKTPAEKETKLVEARGFYSSARAAYTQAFERLESKFKTFPNFIEEGEPLKAEKDRVAGSMMNAELQKAVVDYEEAQSFPADSPQRKEILDRTGKAFEDVYKRHRTQLAGITARMWQGKCYEERGDFGPAKGIYDELLDHADPRLRPLQKKVDYFRIILMGKRKDYALAADEAAAWLRTFPNDRRSYEALGVQLELAKCILAQFPDLNPTDKDRALKRATEQLQAVVKFYSPFKAEALALLNKVAPKAAISAESIARLSFDDAEAEATAAISSNEYDKAIAILRMALRKGVGTQPVEKLNKVRYTLAFAFYMSKRYYEAAILLEHIARRYPGAEWAAKATEIANASLVDAYNEAGANGRPGHWPGDLRRLEDLARYAAETWPDSDPGDTGRMTAGQIALGMGRYPEAIALFEAVRPGTARKADSLGSAGDAHWKRSLALREADPASKEAEAEVQKAIAALKAAIQARKDSGAGDVDLGLIGNACDLATIDLEVGKPEEALKLLEGPARALAVGNRTPTLAAAFARVMAVRLRGHVAVGQVELALADMNSLEQTGGAGADRTTLYLELSRLLEREMDALRKKNNTAALARTQATYRKFLTALVASKTGQTFESLNGAGTGLLKLGAAEEAAGVFDQILKVYGEDSAFLATPNAADRLVLVRLKQAAALRGMKLFPEAEAKLKEVTDQNPRLIEAQMEKGYLLSDRAAAKKGTWAAASTYWQTLAGRLRNLNPKPVQYYEAWLNAAKALQADGKSTLAKQTLGGVMRLSPQVGTPEMKAKYQEMLSQLK